MCLLTAALTLTVSLIALLILIKETMMPFRAAKTGRKSKREEREAEKDGQLCREGIESILAYWPMKKEIGRNGNGNSRDF